MRRKWIFKIPAAVAVVSLGVFVFSGVVMLLWNNLLPAIFHIGAITFWQAMGILVLCKILFGGFRGRGGRHWKKRMFGKWQDMTAEERELFASRMGCEGRYAARA